MIKLKIKPRRQKIVRMIQRFDNQTLLRSLDLNSTFSEIFEIRFVRFVQS